MAPQLVDLRGHIFRGGNTNQIPTRPLVYVRNSSFSAAKEENDTFTTQTISYTQARNIADNVINTNGGRVYSIIVKFIK